MKQIQAVMETTSERWQALCQTLPPELLTRQPAANEWSAIECLQHLIDVEQVFQSRLQAFLEGRDIPAFDPDSEGTKESEALKPLQLAEKFSRLREAGLEMIDNLESDDLDRQVTHAELGPVKLREMLNEWVGHDLIHTIQAERALMQPFIAGCGPWQPYFTEHIIDVAK